MNNKLGPNYASHAKPTGNGIDGRALSGYAYDALYV
uniref:Uncharacterized protein n=1 Tax=Anopheles dirus TaxID=7168 RepID=A0A182NWT1_9DIPT